MDEPPGGAAAGDPTRLFISDLIGAAIKSPSGKALARVKDVVARTSEEQRSPIVHGLLARGPGRDLHFLGIEQIEALEAGAVSLKVDSVDSGLFERRPGEMLLVKDLRDKEVVHVEGKRVVRANDILLELDSGHWVVAGIDMSAASLLAQIGLGALARKRVQREILPWEEVEVFEDSVPVPLNLSHDKISRLHPSDIAKVFHELGYRQISELLEDLPNGIAADVMEDLSPEYQATLLSSLDRDRAADILEEMPPDAAADVLNDILEEDPETADELVQSMESEEAAEVERLRVYDDDTAGGVMTTDYVTMPAGFTAHQAISLLRERKETLPPSIDPLFIVSGLGSRHLVGVLSLTALILAQPDELLEGIMETEIVTLRVQDSAREAARTIAHYNLTALPILDDNERLAGIVPINEAMDLVLPRGWLHRTSRAFRG